MREFIEKSYQYIIREYLKSTFASLDPFGASGDIFSESITDKLILCPIFGYRLDEKQFECLIQTCKLLQIRKVYFSEVEGYDFIDLHESELIGKYLNHYYEIDLDSKETQNYYDEYLNTSFY